MSNDGTLLVTFSHDQSMKIFDVVNFDMMHMLQLPFVPAAAEWVYRVRGHVLNCLQDPHVQYKCGTALAAAHLVTSSTDGVLGARY